MRIWHRSSLLSLALCCCSCASSSPSGAIERVALAITKCALVTITAELQTTQQDGGSRTDASTD
jgi:hypothetical protein